MMNIIAKSIVTLWLLIATSLPVWAVQTTFVKHDSEELFKKGKTDHVVINNRGEIYLSLQSKDILLDKDAAWTVNALLKGPDGCLYAATSGKGIIYKIEQGKTPQVIYGRDKSQPRHVFSLAWDKQGRLLAGTGGEKGLLLRFNIKNAGKPEVLFSDEKVRYIWAIVVGPAGRIYLATGPDGKVITISPVGGNVETLYQAKEKNILSLVLGRDGYLYAGGDEYGLIYRIDPGSKKTVVLYDTGHKEISSLVFDEKGNLYAATSDASGARPGARLILSEGDTSMPAGETGSAKAGASGAKTSDQTENSSSKGNKTTGKSSAKPAPPKKLVPAATSDKGTSTGSKPAKPRMRPIPGKPAQANDIYKITPEGYVVNIFQNKVVILTMKYIAPHKLLLGTGNEGKLISLDIDSQKSVVLNTVEPSRQISALWVDDKGRVYAGCSNPGGIKELKQQYVPAGSYTSPTIDATQIAQWGKLQIEAEIPPDTELQMATRSGNTSDPDKGGWQEWSRPTSIAQEYAVSSPPARFLQYRLFFKGKAQKSPLVKSVQMAYLIPNLPPSLTNLNVKRSGGSFSKKISITWKSTDPNKDKLTYDIYIRLLGHDKWIRIAKEVEKSLYNWDSLTVADGRYEVKVIASDRQSNPLGSALSTSRISRPFVIDNTPPEIVGMQQKIAGHIFHFEAAFQDKLSIVSKVEYILDSEKTWKKAVPVDGILDSSREQVKFSRKINESGEHLIAVRYQDDLGNRAYRYLSVKVASN